MAASEAYAGPDWVGDVEKTVYVYYQGRDCSQAQAAGRLGGEKMVTTTGELASFPYQPIATMPATALWVYPELIEMDCRKDEFSLNTRIKRALKGEVICPVPSGGMPYTPLYPIDETQSLVDYSVDRSLCSLGQDTDIVAHQARVSSMKETLPSVSNIILYGVSRGAATTFAAEAKHHYKNVKLCVLEGLPGSIKKIFAIKAKQWGFPAGWGGYIYQNFAPYFLGGAHRTSDEAQALGYLDKFPNDVPLVIISSLNDEVVPHENSLEVALKVAAKRKESEKTGESVAPVYFLQLDNVGHNNYCTYQSEDALRYQSFMNTMYKSLGLPFIRKYADLSDKDIDVAELTKGVMSGLVDLQSKFEKVSDKEKSILRKAALVEVKIQLARLPDASLAEKIRVVQLAQVFPIFSETISSTSSRGVFSFWSEPDERRRLVAIHEALLEKLYPSTKVVRDDPAFPLMGL